MFYIATYIVLHSWQFLYPMVYYPLWILRKWIKIIIIIIIIITT
jgi:hypothetical protein